MRRIGTGLATAGIAGIALVLLGAPAIASGRTGDDAATGEARAVAELQGRAAAGDPEAEFSLAQAYMTGQGVARDPAKAESLYRNAAGKGYMRAIDAYGLMLFGQGRRQEAMPWIDAAARYGDPRAQYLLGTAAFNGDLAPKDWVRAYALMSRAAGAGMPQAQKSLRQMDQMIPLDQRQKGIALAGKLDEQAQQYRESEYAAADLGAPPVSAAAPAATAPLRPTPPPRLVTTTPLPPSSGATAGLTSDAGADAPRAVTAGADYANPVVLSSRDHRAGDAVRVHSGAVPPSTSMPTPARARAAAPTPAAAARGGDGAWRVQLGAFGERSNADALWARTKARSELAGKTRFNEPAGKVTRLQAGGFASEADAARACTGLKTAGFACVTVRP